MDSVQHWMEEPLVLHTDTANHNMYLCLSLNMTTVEAATFTNIIMVHWIMIYHQGMER